MIRVVLGAVVTALVVAGGASAGLERSPTAAHRSVGPAIALANSMPFTDAVGDSGDRPDISGGSVSNDDAGMITFTVNLANRPALSPDDFVQIVIDADNASYTGDDGFEYVIQYGFASNPTRVAMAKWDGSRYPILQTTTLSAAFSGGTLTVALSFRELDDTAGIQFYVHTDIRPVVADGPFDEAPDGNGIYSYQVKTPLLLDKFIAPAKVKAGKGASAMMYVTTDDDVHGVVTCRATIAGKPVRGQPSWGTVLIIAPPSATGLIASPFAYKAFAFCEWKLPKTAKRKLLKGTITAAKEGLTLSRSFSVRIG